MKRFLALVAALAVLASSGYVHGLWTERWQTSAALEKARARVDDVPMVLGPWQAKTLEGDAAAFQQAGAQSYWVREYTHVQRKISLTAILMCGRAGRMSVHTPDICFRGAGYEIADAPAEWKAPVGDNALWSARFTKPASGSSDLRLFWSWNAGGKWEIPANPRWHFRGKPFLYKLYVMHDALSPKTDDGPAAEFFSYLVPALEKTLFSRTP